MTGMALFVGLTLAIGWAFDRLGWGRPEGGAAHGPAEQGPAATEEAAHGHR